VQKAPELAFVHAPLGGAIASLFSVVAIVRGERPTAYAPNIRLIIVASGKMWKVFIRSALAFAFRFSVNAHSVAADRAHDVGQHSGMLNRSKLFKRSKSRTKSKNALSRNVFST
jgi:hypothetical protein